MKAAAAALLALGALAHAPAALAAPEGLRPLGLMSLGARGGEPGHLRFELGAALRQPGAVSAQGLDADDLAVLARQSALPLWPDLWGAYTLGADGAEAFGHVGEWIGGGYRRPLMKAVAPWPGEDLEAYAQLGAGWHWSAVKPYAELRVPTRYTRGAWTLSIVPGARYAFNQQPLVEVEAGLAYRPWPWLEVAGGTRLKMDAQKLTPTDGTYDFTGGARVWLGERLAVEVTGLQDAGAPLPATSTIDPVVFFPATSVKVAVTSLW